MLLFCSWCLAYTKGTAYVASFNPTFGASRFSSNTMHVEETFNFAPNAPIGREIGAPIGCDQIVVGGPQSYSARGFGLHSCLLVGERDLAPHAALLLLVLLWLLH